MGFFDKLKALTQPYDEDEDFFEGSDRPEKLPAQSTQEAVSSAQAEFESKFGFSAEPRPQQRETDAPESASLFGNLGGMGLKRQKSPGRERTPIFGSSGSAPTVFTPHEFDDARILIGYLREHRSVVMTLEGLPTDFARRMLDLCSGVALALDGKITFVSAKTYFVTPANVDIVGAQSSSVESDGEYF